LNDPTSTSAIILRNCKALSIIPRTTSFNIYDEVLIESGRISALGEEARVRGRGAREYDLGGTLALPGLCDAHLHLAAGGRSLSIPDLSRLHREEISIALIEAFGRRSNAPDLWLEAFNWDEDCARLDADMLEYWVPGKPVIVHKRDLHSCCLNRTALAQAGVTADTQDPSGGKIERDAQGRPTGRLYESAVELALRALPEMTGEVRKGHVLAAQDYIISLGHTAVSEVLDADTEDVYFDLDAEGRLKVEIDGWRRADNWDGSPPPAEGRCFRVETLKLFLDGSFGSKTAALFDPFSDDGGDVGVLFFRDEDLFDLAVRATAIGWRLAIHAIGDRATAQACRILTKIPAPRRGLHRIEHLQLLPQDGLECILRSRAAASIQPIHLLDDQVWLPSRIGPERCKRSFIWKSLADRGVTVALGSDWPVATPDPLLNIQTAIHRAGFEGEPHPAFEAGEALTPIQTILGCSYNWAVATGLTNRRGTIAVGMDADLTIVDGWDENLINWRETSVIATAIKGSLFFK